MLFVAQLDRRDALQRHLAAQGIGTAIHYPTPIHLLPAARALGHHAGDFPVAERQARRILSLPHHPAVTAAQVARVAVAINAFYRG